ncbi:MAG: hypothetical protein KKF30_02480 [Proteobacteria bacterium]|nr:hypothetical protein [Pseudomonadota bacterium]MBU4472180.1 hypothetical protein [Pseudomonadota bacterium]MCG2750389.1 hypothetical protein [Desulfobacteraceae bacterium]
MDKQNIFEVYEKLYFHEVEAREKISSRLQIPLAILLSIISVYAHIIKGISLNNHCFWNIIFALTFISSIILFVTSMSYFIRSFYGHTYEFIPSAIETENYRQKLIETYKEYDDGESIAEQYFDEYIYKYYNECSSLNTKVNDTRSEFLHKCNTYLILSALPLVAAFLIFTLAGIDKNSVDKEYKIKITNPIEINKDTYPIQINGEIRSYTETIDGLKEKMHEREITTTTSAPASEENSQGGRSGSKNATTTKTVKE